MKSPSFTDKVYKVVERIPLGKVLTYKEVARLAGSPLASRAVGMAMKHNPDMARIPCHRVVASDGALCGYSAGKGLETKRQKLFKEGVVFKGTKVDLAAARMGEDILPDLLFWS